MDRNHYSYSIESNLGSYSTSQSYPYVDYSYTASPEAGDLSFETNDTAKHTPSSLGWTANSELVKLYDFVVSKTKEPYLELLPEWTATYETPRRVYLDAPRFVISHSHNTAR